MSPAYLAGREEDLVDGVGGACLSTCMHAHKSRLSIVLVSLGLADAHVWQECLLLT